MILDAKFSSVFFHLNEQKLSLYLSAQKPSAMHGFHSHPFSSTGSYFSRLKVTYRYWPVSNYVANDGKVKGYERL
jgi:hypothetical protein